MARHIMIDIETLGTGDDAVIMEVGAVEFFDAPSEVGVSFSSFVEVGDQRGNGRKVDKGTIKWWVDTDVDRLIEFFENAIGLPDEVLASISDLCAGADTIWAKGPNFDIGILEHAMKMYGVEIPWKFWQVRDARTLYKLADTEVDYGDKHHSALNDAKCQVRALFEAAEKLGAKIQ